MEKTKKEIIEKNFRDNAFILSSSIMHYLQGGAVSGGFKSALEKMMEEYGSQCRKEGFESFREKAEGAVKKLEDGAIILNGYSEGKEWVLHESVLTTIKELKQ